MSHPDPEPRIAPLRTLGTALLGSIGQVLGAQSCGPSVTAGFIAEPFALPRDYDRSRPGFLFAPLRPTPLLAPAARRPPPPRLLPPQQLLDRPTNRQERPSRRGHLDRHHPARPRPPASLQPPLPVLHLPLTP